jgi:hypothetical protein
LGVCRNVAEGMQQRMECIDVDTKKKRREEPNARIRKCWCVAGADSRGEVSKFRPSKRT